MTKQNLLEIGSRFWIVLLVLMLLPGCASLSVFQQSFHPSQSHPSHNSSPISMVRLVDVHGIETWIEIPKTGLLLGQVIRQYDSHSTGYLTADSAILPSNNDSSDALESAFDGLDAHSRNLQIALEDSQYDPRDEQVELLVDLMKKKLRDTDGAMEPDKLLQDYVTYLVSEKVFVLFSTFAKPMMVLRTPSHSGVPRLSAASSRSSLNPPGDCMVALNRASGEKLVFPLSQIRRTSFSGILMSSGDSVSIVESSFFESPSSRDNARVLLSGLTQNAGRMIDLVGPSNLKQLHQMHASPYADIAIISRQESTGKLRHHLVAVSENAQEPGDTQLCDGDLIQFANMELLPILIDSRARSRQLQIEAIETQRLSHRGHWKSLRSIW